MNIRFIPHKYANQKGIYKVASKEVSKIVIVLNKAVFAVILILNNNYKNCQFSRSLMNIDATFFIIFLLVEIYILIKKYLSRS